MSRRRPRTPAEAFGEALADLVWRVGARLLDGLETRLLDMTASTPPAPRAAVGTKRPPQPSVGNHPNQPGRRPGGAGRKPPARPVLQTRKIRGVWHVV